MFLPSLLRKAQPTASDLHVDRLLTNISIAFHNPSYIADHPEFFDPEMLSAVRALCDDEGYPKHGPLS